VSSSCLSLSFCLSLSLSSRLLVTQRRLMVTSPCGRSQARAEEPSLSIKQRPITSPSPRRIYSACRVTQIFACEERRQTADALRGFSISSKKQKQSPVACCVPSAIHPQRDRALIKLLIYRKDTEDGSRALTEHFSPFYPPHTHTLLPSP